MIKNTQVNLKLQTFLSMEREGRWMFMRSPHANYIFLSRTIDFQGWSMIASLSFIKISHSSLKLYEIHSESLGTQIRFTNRQSSYFQALLALRRVESNCLKHTIADFSDNRKVDQ